MFLIQTTIFFLTFFVCLRSISYWTGHPTHTPPPPHTHIHTHTQNYKKEMTARDDSRHKIGMKESSNNCHRIVPASENNILSCRQRTSRTAHSEEDRQNRTSRRDRQNMKGRTGQAEQYRQTGQADSTGRIGHV
jgi:hypothetical protein